MFEKAAREQYRYNSSVGALTTEQLFTLPLTSQRGTSLDDVGKIIVNYLRQLGEESLVESSTNAAEKDTLNTKLEIIKFIIADKQAANKAAAERIAKREKRHKILEQIDKKDQQELEGKTRAELEAELAALD